VICSLLVTFGGVRSNIEGPEETVQELKKGRSLIRFGDGEFGIYRNRDIHYQRWSQSLKDEFEKIKQDYEADAEHCPYILAMPKAFMTVSGWKLMKKRVYVSSWAESRRQFKKTFRRDIVYGDSFLFEKKNKPIYSEIWNGENCPQNIVFVHNSAVCAQAFCATYQKRVEHVACPPKDAFESVDILEKEILSKIETNGWTSKDVMITISAGPAGKVLVYRLSKQGYHCVDAGHCWDDPLEGI
jgi:hypothetical protein